jgi:hypothetical protein
MSKCSVASLEHSETYPATQWSEYPVDKKPITMEQRVTGIRAACRLDAAVEKERDPEIIGVFDPYRSVSEVIPAPIFT